MAAVRKRHQSFIQFIWHNSLVGKFVSLTVIVVFLLMGISAVINYQSQKQAVINNIQSQSQMLGSFVVSIAPEALLSYDYDALNNYMEEINKGEDIVYAIILSPEGNAMTSYVERRNQYISHELDKLNKLNLKQLIASLKQNKDIIHQSFPILFQDKMLGHFKLGIDKRRIEAASQKKLINQIFISSILTVLLGIGIYIVFRTYIMNPIKQLVSGAQRITHGTLDRNVEVISSDELGNLGRVFNQMMDKLRASIKDKDDALQTVQELNHYLEERVIHRTRELESLNQKLEKLALHDSLTNLPNRFCIQDRLNKMIVEARRDNSCFTVIMMDLDRFKEINDTLGHDCGDQLLIEIGIRLKEMLRPSDFIGRLGGDEFAMLLPDTDEQGAKFVSEKIHHVLEPSFYLSDMAFSISASIGIATYPRHGNSTSSILKSADVAMYYAKNHKLDFCVYNPVADFNTPDRLSLMGELRFAIQNEQLELYFQPEVELSSKRIIAVEALTRWNHPERGFIAPDEFIPMAEQSGLIRSMTYWVIKSAIEQAEAWQKMGIDIAVSVNLSMQNLHDPDFAMNLAAMLNNTPVANNQFEFEVTESAIMSDPDYVVKVLDQLGALDVSIAIDDFGTGYSSLSQLKKLPVHKLKIDKSFVMDMAVDSDDETIVHSVIDMAHTLGLTVIAEGVENGSVMKQLNDLACDYIQGYYISRPLPARKITPLLRDLNWGNTGKKPGGNNVTVIR